MPSLRQRLHRPHLEGEAYALPLAVAATGVLMVLSLTLQSVAMQERLQVGALERQRRDEDLLASAAHQWLAALNGAHSCLLTLPLERWESEGGVCASPTALGELGRALVMAAPVRLLAWTPSADGKTAEMKLELEAGPGRGRRLGRFRVGLVGVPLQAVDPRARSLAGALP
jgi:hypothetical protein